MLTVSIPTINDEQRDFDRLFNLWHQVNDDFLKVTFDFSQCGFLRQNAVAFLGGLARMIEQRFGTVTFDWNTLQENIRTNLAQNGFIAAFEHRGRPWHGNSIPYREDISMDKEVLVDYLKTKWLERGWVHVSTALRDAIIGRVSEIYVNAFEHGKSEIGVFSCGQHYPSLGVLKLSVVDFGVGIPSNVRVFMHNPRISAESALKWAFQSGTTTKPNGVGRGLGLDLLKKFVEINHGRLEVLSHEGYALIESGQEAYAKRNSYFEGTVVNITLRCDEKYYCLSSETLDESLFS